MAKTPLLTLLLIADAIAFGLFPTYMVAHMFAFQVVPGPSVASSELSALVEGVFYFFMYPLEMWGPWLLFPAFVAPASAAAILILSVAIWKGRPGAALPLVLVVAAYNALELIAGGYIILLAVANIAIGSEVPLQTLAGSIFLFALRIGLVCLVVAINARILLRLSPTKGVLPAA